MEQQSQQWKNNETSWTESRLPQENLRRSSHYGDGIAPKDTFSSRASKNPGPFAMRWAFKKLNPHDLKTRALKTVHGWKNLELHKYVKPMLEHQPPTDQVS